MAVKQIRRRNDRPPLDQAALEQAALAYAGRYATTRARLQSFLRRKLRERGWAGEGEPRVEEMVERMAALGYVDDRAFASARAVSLSRRGYGGRRIRDALSAAGVGGDDVEEAHRAVAGEAWEAALRFARKRRIGPFAEEEPSRQAREKAMAAMLRAGHSLELARRIVHAVPGDVPEADSH